MGPDDILFDMRLPRIQIMSSNAPSKAAFSIPSIIAVIAAILSFKMGAFFGFILAVVAIIAGALGVILSLSPARRGGIVSVFGVFAGGIGIIAAVVKAISWLANL